MTRTVVVKSGLLLTAAGLVALGAVFLVLPGKNAGGWLLPQDRVAGFGLVLCGLVFAAFALLVKRGGPASSDGAPPNQA